MQKLQMQMMMLLLALVNYSIATKTMFVAYLSAMFQNRAVQGAAMFMLAVGAAMFFPDPAYADLDLTGITFDMAPLETVATLLIGVFSSVFVIRLVISMFRRGNA